MAGHPLGPRWSLVTPRVTTANPRPGAAGSSQGPGLQQDALCRTGLSHPSSWWKCGVRARHFLPSAASPTYGLAGGQDSEPPPPLSSLGARSQALLSLLHPPRAPQTERSPLEQGGFGQPRLSPPHIEMLSQKKFPSVLSQRELAASFLLFPPFPWTCFPREVQERPGRQTLLPWGMAGCRAQGHSFQPCSQPSLSALRSLTVGQGEGT